MSKILNILLQRNDSQYPWGFTIAGTSGALYIDKVSPGALSAQHLTEGDRVLSMAGIDSERLDVHQVEDMICCPGKSLELVVLKGTKSPRKFSDGSESVVSSTGSAPLQWRCRPSSSASVDARKAKRQFWERCSGLQPKDFYNSIDSELFRSRGRHSRSHSLERGGSVTPTSFSSNTDIYRSSVISEPIWAFKTGRRSHLFDWDRTQSYPDDSKLYSEMKSENKNREDSTEDKFYSRQHSCPDGQSSESFNESVPNKPGKFPWFSSAEEFGKSSSTKKLDEEKEFLKSNRTEFSSSVSERYSTKTYNKKEMKMYEMEESSSSDANKKYVKEKEKSYLYRKSGSFLEDNSSFEEGGRSHTPAGFYENHCEEFVKEERSFVNERGKSIEREEISSHSYSRESTVDRNVETTSPEVHNDFHSSSKVNGMQSDRDNSKHDSFVEPKLKSNFSNRTEERKEKSNFIRENSVERTIENNIHSEIKEENQLSSKHDHVRSTSEILKQAFFAEPNPVHCYSTSNTNKQQENSASSEYSTATSRSEFINSDLEQELKQESKIFDTSLVNSRENLISSDKIDNRYSSSECFAKCISNKDKRNIFDARKYLSCTSPTVENKYIFVPVQKPTVMLVQQNEKPYSLNDSSRSFYNLPDQSKEVKEKSDIGRQQNQISGGGNGYSPTPTSPVSAPCFDSSPAAAPPAPPPPPPPPGSGGVPPPPPPIGLVHIPAIRLKSEIPDVRREPPAAIQNAMMKDKKPFTYTPGGLDLSEIRSPRMQRRISRNAQTTDSTQGPPPSQPQQNRPVSLPPSAAAAMQPQIAIPVFPQGNHIMNQSGPPPPPPPAPPVNNFHVSQPSPPPPPQPMAVPKMQPQRQQIQNTGSIYVPPVQQQSQPRQQLGSLYIPPIHNQQDNNIPMATPTPPTPSSAQLNKAPTPWMSRPIQQQKEVPPWVNREDSTPSPTVTSPHIQNNQKQPQQQQARVIPIQIEGREPSQPNTRIIPIRLEGSPSPQQNISQPNFQQQPTQYQQNQHQQYQQPQQQRWPVYVHNKFNPPSPSSNENSNIANGRNQQPTQQNWVNSPDGSTSPAPVQSRSFRVLQKITDTDPIEGDQVDAPYNSQGVPLSQLRKLQLSDDDRALMNKVKNQVSDTILPVDEENPRYRGGYIPSRVFKALDESVDEETFLHTESEPRYRGAAIPSRAFRMLQNMTDNAGNVPQGPNDNQMRLPNRRPHQSETPSPAQPYIHPSEQQVQEPRMYTGSAIPSRSFRMLQAMTGPDPSGSQVCQSGSECNNSVEGEWTNNPYQSDPNYYYYYYPQQTPEEQQQFWNHYNAMCAYMAEMNAAAYRYSPHPHAYSPQPYGPPPLPPLPAHYYSDNEEYSGYSSTEEMSRYYQPYLQNYPPPGMPFYQYHMQPTTPTPEIKITPTNQVESTKYTDESSDAERESDKNESTPVPPSETGESEESSSGSDTEVEDSAPYKPNGLQTIKSVPNISIYKDSSSSDIQSRTSGEHGDEEDEDEDDDDEENEEEQEEQNDQDDDEPCGDDDDSSVHQLSVIYEESEHSDAESIRKKSFSSHHGSLVAATTSEDDCSSTTTLDNGEDTDEDDDDDDDEIDDPESSTVMVRLPLKLKFSKSENNEEVTTVIVGNSEVESTTDIPTKCEGMIIEEITKDDSEPDVSVTISLKKPKQTSETPSSVKGTAQSSKIVDDLDKEIDKKEDSEREKSPEIDFWKALNSDDQTEESVIAYQKEVSSTTEDEEVKLDESDYHWEDDSSSTSVQTVRTGTAFHTGSGSEVDTDAPGLADETDNNNCRTSPCNVGSNDTLEFNKSQIDEDESESEDSSDEDSSCSSTSSSEDSDCENEKIESAKSEQIKQKNITDDVFGSNRVISKTVTSSKISNKENEDISKDNCDKKDTSGSHEDSEEDDSGVTSDMSRHISETDTDPECGTELRKLSRYQRAATHSRLFKLLQDECAQEDDEPVIQNADTVVENVSHRKERLTLPLYHNNSTSEPDSLSSSSGVNSPSSPTVNDRLVKELVQSLLKRKKGRSFRKLPIAKLHAAALRILQEDMDQYDTTSTTSEDNTANSPLGRTRTETQADMTSQANDNTAIANQNAFFDNNYYDYCQYYSSWGYPMYYGVEDSLGQDIVPSRAFRLLQEHAAFGNFSPGFIDGLNAKCPKVFSSSNIPKELCSKSPLPSEITSESTTPSTET